MPLLQKGSRRIGEETIISDLTYDLRSGDPDFIDKLVALTFGNMAYDAILEGKTGLMSALMEGCYDLVPIPDAKLGPRKLDVASMYNTERYRPSYANKRGLPMFPKFSTPEGSHVSAEVTMPRGQFGFHCRQNALMMVRRPLRGGVDRNMIARPMISAIWCRPLRAGVDRNRLTLRQQSDGSTSPLRGGVFETANNDSIGRIGI
jgi:hypothetical protein